MDQADSTLKQIMLFKRLDFAIASLLEAKALTEHVLKLGLKHGSAEAALYHACCTGIVCAYVRPFTISFGLEIPMPETFKEGFPNEDLKSTHDSLIWLRNQIYAHRDHTDSRSQSGDLSLQDERYKDRLTLTVAEGQLGFLCAPIILGIKDDFLPSIIPLCDFQSRRFKDAAATVFYSLAGNKVYTPGAYTLGVDFP